MHEVQFQNFEDGNNNSLNCTFVTVDLKTLSNFIVKL